MRLRICCQLFLIFLLFIIACQKTDHDATIEQLQEKAATVQKKEALNTIATCFKEGKYHKLKMIECAKLVIEANANIDVITRAAQQISETGSQTKTYMGIARIAAKANHECQELMDILELSLIKHSESDKIISLAQKATRAITQEDKETVREEIKKMTEGVNSF